MFTKFNVRINISFKRLIHFQERKKEKNERNSFDLFAFHIP